jgi:hypothetical protein
MSIEYSIITDVEPLHTITLPFGLGLTIKDDEIKKLTWNGNGKAYVVKNQIKPNPDVVMILFLLCCDLELTSTPPIDNAYLSRLIHKIRLRWSIWRVLLTRCDEDCPAIVGYDRIGPYIWLKDIFGTMSLVTVRDGIRFYEISGENRFEMFKTPKMKSTHWCSKAHLIPSMPDMYNKFFIWN